jgi:CMP-N,N'-diacetyllegionaminic acid synthase
MTVVAIIPARGGSRGLRAKNLRLLTGRPLIGFSIQAALASHEIDRVIVTTDSEAIADAARIAGADVPFLRPASLATDASPTIDAVVHAVEYLETTTPQEQIDLVVTLQPTSPFRTATHIDHAIDLVRQRGADSAVSVSALGLPASVIGYIEGDGAFVSAYVDGDLRRQAARPAARINGAIYISSRALLREHRLLGARPIAVVLEGAAGMDIDDAADLGAARRHLRRSQQA